MPTRAFPLALLLFASVASADVIHIARPRSQPPEAQRLGLGESFLQAAGTAPECTNAAGTMLIPCAVAMEYFGGAVLSNVKVYAVYWSSGVSPAISGGMGGFYRTLTNSEWVDWLTEYSTQGAADAGSHQGQPGTGQVVGRGTFAGSVTLTAYSKTYPACPSPNQLLTCVSSADVEAELDWQVRHGRLPVPDANTLFMVHFPPTVQVGDKGNMACQQFCAYHSTFQGTYQAGVPQPVFYAVMPDVSANGCQKGCGLGTAFQNTCAAASHEIAEAITDSEIGLVTGSNVDYPAGWYDTENPSQGEVGDMCNQSSDTVDTRGLTGCTAGAAGCYTVQQIFSREVWNANPVPSTAACVSARYDVDDYALALTPNTLTLAPGDTSAPLPVVTTISNGAAQPVTLSVTDIPAGLHASFDSTTLNSGGTASLTVSADANAPLLRDGVLVVRATGAATHSASLLVQVANSQNDWSLTLSPSSAALLPGTSRVFTVNGQVTSGKAELVSLNPTVTGLPPGVTASFSPSTLTPGASAALLTLSASSTAAGAPASTFTATATSPSQTAGHTVSAQVQVDTPPSVSITSPAAGASVAGTTQVQVVATPGANASLASITIAVDSDAPLSSGTASTVAWDTKTATNGNHTLHVTALDTDSATASASVVVTVVNILNDFTLSSAPASVSLPIGGTATLTVTTALAAGNPEVVSLSVSGLPPGVSAAFAPAQVTAGRTATLTLTAPSGTQKAPATPITLLGTSPSQPAGHRTTATLSVQQGGGCSASGGGRASLWLALLAGAGLWRGRRRTAGAV